MRLKTDKYAAKASRPEAPSSTGYYGHPEAWELDTLVVNSTVGGWQNPSPAWTAWHADTAVDRRKPPI
jgi:hypothetical protein